MPELTPAFGFDRDSIKVIYTLFSSPPSSRDLPAKIRSSIISILTCNLCDSKFVL